MLLLFQINCSKWKECCCNEVYRKNYNLISVRIYTNLNSKKFTTSCKIILRKRPQQAANIIFSAKSFLNQVIPMQITKKKKKKRKWMEEIKRLKHSILSVHFLRKDLHQETLLQRSFAGSNIFAKTFCLSLITVKFF